MNINIPEIWDISYMYLLAATVFGLQCSKSDWQGAVGSKDTIALSVDYNQNK